MLSHFTAFSRLLSALMHSYVFLAFVPMGTRSRSSRITFAPWTQPRGFQGAFCPSAAPQLRTAPVPFPHATVPPFGSHRSTLWGSRDTSWGRSCHVPAGCSGWGVQGSSALQRGWGGSVLQLGMCPVAAVPVAPGNAVAMGTRQVEMLRCWLGFALPPPGPLLPWEELLFPALRAHHHLSKTPGGRML